MTIPTVIGEFWSAFVATLVADPSHRFYEAFHFNDNAPTADELAQLVLSGKKRATAGSSGLLNQKISLSPCLGT